MLLILPREDFRLLGVKHIYSNLLTALCVRFSLYHFQGSALSSELVYITTTRPPCQHLFSKKFMIFLHFSVSRILCFITVLFVRLCADTSRESNSFVRVLGGLRHAASAIQASSSHTAGSPHPSTHQTPDRAPAVPDGHKDNPTCVARPDQSARRPQSPVQRV